jgi:hypothetical protein
MTTTFEGRLTLGECIPAAAAAQVNLGAVLASSMPDVEARIGGLLAIQARPPPALADLIAAVQQLLAALQALAAAPFPDLAATAAALADLQATLGQLQAFLALNVELGALLGTAGIYYYLFAGRATEVGPELASLLAVGLPGVPIDQRIAGAVLLAADGGAIAALQAVLKA